MINTTLVYIEKDGSLLMLCRNKKKNDLNEGKWVGVGGKFEPGETAKQCMLRETFEETGLTPTEYELCGVIGFVSDRWEDETMYLYRVSSFEGELREDCSEGVLEWVPKERVMDLPMWEGDRYFLEPMRRGEKDVRLTVVYEGDRLAEVREGLPE